MTTDPPPDLAIEVEVTRSALNRMGIYAKLGVPEVWRFDCKELRVYLRNPQGEYEERPRSRMFSQVAPTDLVRFIGDGTFDDDTALIRSFRAWLRKQLGLKS